MTRRYLSRDPAGCVCRLAVVAGARRCHRYQFDKCQIAPGYLLYETPSICSYHPTHPDLRGAPRTIDPTRHKNCLLVERVVVLRKPKSPDTGSTSGKVWFLVVETTPSATVSRLRQRNSRGRRSPKGKSTAETSRRIACDSSIVTINEEKNGEPLSIGRRSRTIPSPMRRALRARDKGCCCPGCTNTGFVDWHHIEHWADGGETSLDNLVVLCRHHHHLVHEGGFVCEKSADGIISFKGQREHRLEPSPPVPGVAANDDVQQWIDREYFEANIDSETSSQAGPRCAARWQAGQRMDWHAAVGSLFS